MAAHKTPDSKPCELQQLHDRLRHHIHHSRGMVEKEKARVRVGEEAVDQESRPHLEHGDHDTAETILHSAARLALDEGVVLPPDDRFPRLFGGRGGRLA